MNVDLFEKIANGGLTMTSPSVNVANNAVSALDNVSAQVQLIGNTSDINTAVFDRITQSLLSAKNGVSSSISHISNTANDSLKLANMAQQANKVDALINRVPTSCFNTEALFSAVNGELDDTFDVIGNAVSGLSSQVGDYLAGRLSAETLESYFENASELLNSSVDYLTDQVSKEKALAEEIFKKVQVSSLAQSVQSIWKNDCTRSVLHTVLPSDIKALL